MRFQGEAFRAHDPAWSGTPLSGAGAALAGRRFNWPGLETLHLSCRIETALREVSAGFAHRLSPYVLVSYDVDCEDIADLATEAGRGMKGGARRTADIYSEGVRVRRDGGEGGGSA